jgi:hypothetical protein
VESVGRAKVIDQSLAVVRRTAQQIQQIAEQHRLLFLIIYSANVRQVVGDAAFG